MMKRIEIGTYTNNDGIRMWNVSVNGSQIEPATADEKRAKALANRLYDGYQHAIMTLWNGDEKSATNVSEK